MSRIFVGVLKNMGDVAYTFYPEGEEKSFPVDPEIAKGVQYNYRIWLNVDTGEWGRLSEALGSEMRERKHILLLKTCREDTDEEDRLVIAEATKRIGAELARFYQYYASDIWDVQVYADAVLEDQAPWNNNWNASMFQSYINDHQIQMPVGFNPNYFHCWSHYRHDSYCGLGQLYNKYSWTQESCGLHTIIHELGHNLGLHHASKDDREYGDSTCVMGSGTNIPGLNAVQVAKLRKAARRPFWKVTETSAGYLVPVETSDHWLWPEDNTLAEVENRGQRVWVSLRKHRGVPYDFGSPPEERLHVHTKGELGKTMYHTAIAPDRSFVLPNGVECFHLGYDRTNERAKVFFRYTAVGKTHELPPVEGDYPPNLPAPADDFSLDGQWYNPEYDGQGVSIVGGEAVLFTFEQTEVHMPRTDHTWVPLYPTESRLIPLDRNNILLLVKSAEHGKNAIELKRLANAGTGRWTGEWPTLDGFLHIHRGIRRYEGTLVDVAYIARTGGSWYIAVGEDIVAGIPIYKSGSNRWLARGSKHLEKVGTIRLDDEHGIVTWSVGGTEYSQVLGG